MFFYKPSLLSSSPSASPPFFKVKSDPFKKEAAKKEVEEKMTSIKSSEKRTLTGSKTSKWVQNEDHQLGELITVGADDNLSLFYRTLPKKDDKKTDKPSEKDNKDGSKKPDAKNDKVEVPSSTVVQEKKDEKKHIRKLGCFNCWWCNL